MTQRLAERHNRSQDRRAAIGKGETWAAIVRKYRLAAQADMHQFVGESFGLTDFAFANGAKEVNPILVSTIKARQAGFHDCIDSEDLLKKCFRRFQELRLLPMPNT